MEQTAATSQTPAKRRVKRVRRPRVGLAKGMVVRVYPTPEQAQKLTQWMGACRWTWNWALGQQNAHYAKESKHLGVNGLSRELTQAMNAGFDPVSGRDITWLREVPRTCLTSSFRSLQGSWSAFFDGLSGKRADKPGKPRFHAFRDERKSVGFQVDPRHKSKLDVAAGTISITCLGKLHTIFTESIPGDVSNITIARQGGQWFASLALVNVPQEAAKRLASWETVDPGNAGGVIDPRFRQFDDPMDPSGFVGLDASVVFGAVATSDGETTYTLATMEDRERADRKRKRKQRYQRQFSRAMEHRKLESGIAKGKTIPKGTRLRQSNRQRKLADKIAKIDLHLANARKDRAHKFTTELVRNHHTIVGETLNLKALAKSMRTAFRRRFHEASMGEIFRQLKYKCQWHDRVFIQVDMWFPSSKRCSQCHQKNHDLKLSERAWVCPHCHSVHDRDDNAAFNLWQEGQRLKALLIEGEHNALALTTAGSAVAARQVGSDLDAGVGCSAPAEEAVSGVAQSNAPLATAKPLNREVVLIPAARQRARSATRMDRVKERVG